MKKRSKSGARPKGTQTAVGGPFLTTAFICEKALNEKDGVQSFIRVFDRLSINFSTGEDIEDKRNRTVAITLAVVFKSGDFKGTKSLEIRVNRTARNETKPLGKPLEIAFEGGEHGPGVIVEVLFAAFEPDLVWFEVVLDKQIVSKIPLRIVATEPLSAARPEPERKR